MCEREREREREREIENVREGDKADNKKKNVMKIPG